MRLENWADTDPATPPSGVCATFTHDHRPYRLTLDERHHAASARMDPAVADLPVLFLDADGPLIPFAAKPHRRPEGFTTHRLLTPRWTRAEQERLSRTGRPHARVKPLRVWADPTLGPRLPLGHYQAVWATTWREEANEYLADLFGLPRLPSATLPEHADTRDRLHRPGRTKPHWKLPYLLDYAQGRPFAWVDDEANDADAAYLERIGYPAPTLLLTADPRTGITARDLDALARFAHACPRGDVHLWRISAPWPDPPARS